MFLNKLHQNLIWALLIIVISTVLTGCMVTGNTPIDNTNNTVVDDSTNDLSESSHSEKEPNSSKDFPSIADNPKTDNEHDTINDIANSKYIPDFDNPYHFYDVFRNEYEMDINKSIPANPYNPDNYSYLIKNETGKLITNIEIKEDTDLFIPGEESLGYTGTIKYEDENYTSKFGIDVSRFQKNIDWKKVKEFGVEFAFIRVGYRGYGKEGSLEQDQYYKQNISGAQNAGIDVGVYFFAQAINEMEAKEEAEYVINLISDYDIPLPIVYDPEHIRSHAARTDDITAEQFTQNTKIFCETMQKAGYTPMLYSNMLWEAFEIDLSQIPDVEIWYADYELKPQTPYIFKVWQYSQAGKIPGINGRVDLNIMMAEK